MKTSPSKARTNYSIPLKMQPVKIQPTLAGMHKIFRLIGLLIEMAAFVSGFMNYDGITTQVWKQWFRFFFKKGPCMQYSMIHLTCNITNLYCSARWHDSEFCHSLFERVFICIYAIPHPDTYLWCQFRHFYIQNEVSHSHKFCQENFPFKKSKEIWTVKRSTLRLPNLIP